MFCTILQPVRLILVFIAPSFLIAGQPVNDGASYEARLVVVGSESNGSAEVVDHAHMVFIAVSASVAPRVF